MDGMCVKVFSLKPSNMNLTNIIMFNKSSLNKNIIEYEEQTPKSE